MQVFLPYPDFHACARVLDNKRLGNQCYRECVTLFGGSWPNHPASRMFRNYERELAKYALALAEEMGRRGKTWKPSVVERWTKFWGEAIEISPNTGAPPWLGDPAFHLSHQSNLLRKDKNWYSKFFNVPDDLPYVWP